MKLIKLKKYNKILQLIKLLDINDKKKFLLIVVLSLLQSLLDTASIALFVPFINMISNPNIIHSNYVMNVIYSFFGFTSDISFIIAVGVFIIGFYFLRAIYTLLYQMQVQKYVYGLVDYFIKNLFSKFIQTPYSDYLNQSPSYFNNMIVGYPESIAQLVSNALNFCTQMFTLISIYVILMFIDFKITIIMTSLLLCIVYAVNKYLLPYLKNYGTKANSFRIKLLKELQKQIGNFKLLKLLQERDILTRGFFTVCKETNHNLASYYAIQNLPRIILECVGFIILIFIIILNIIITHDLKESIGVLTMFGLAFYKLLPSINNISNSFNQMIFLTPVIENIQDEIG